MYPSAMQASDVREGAVRLKTLDQAFRWALKQSPRLEPVYVVVQDEYTHDVLFGARDGSFLVFDAT
jgi:hypothetical protein